MILRCQNIEMSFGVDLILDKVSFHINDKDKLAIVGANGAGKSTLLKIIAGELSADEGEVIFKRGASFGYLAQEQNLSSHNNIYDEMMTVKEDVINLYNRIRRLEHDMKDLTGDKLERKLATYTQLVHQFEIQNGYASQSEVIGILKGLGFGEDDFDKKVNTLSGGQKTRIALGKILLSKPDIILLDEPTNHLDLVSISWLENFLLNYDGTVIIISHDRYFLDKIVTKVLEIDHTKSRLYSGNYSNFVQKKAELESSMLKQYENQQREIKHQEEVITKLRSFNREKSIRRAESREKLLAKIELIEKPTDQSQIHLALEPRVTSGNDVLSVKGLSKSFGDLKLFSDIDFQIKRGEKVAIIGNNGTGKTTLLKIINKQLEADKGEINYGTNVEIAYFDQEYKVLDPEKTLFDELHDAYPNLSNTEIRSLLAAFLFKDDDVFKLIKELSGGERGRVSLSKLMLSKANLLIMDEPTNHLDIASKEILENALNNYTGTVLYVSHDRYFINKTATRILDLTNYKFLNYIGNYDYYIEKKPDMEAAHFGTSIDKTTVSSVNPSILPFAKMPTSTSKASNSDSPTDNKLSWIEHKEEQAKLRKREKQLKETEDEIAKLENRNNDIDQLISQDHISTDVEQLIELHKEKESNEKRLEELMDIWEELLTP